MVDEGLTEEAYTYKPVADWADKLVARIKEVFFSRTSHEWKKKFGRAGIPAAPQRWLQEWIYD